MNKNSILLFILISSPILASEQSKTAVTQTAPTPLQITISKAITPTTLSISPVTPSPMSSPLIDLSRSQSNKSFSSTQPVAAQPSMASSKSLPRIATTTSPVPMSVTPSTDAVKPIPVNAKSDKESAENEKRNSEINTRTATLQNEYRALNTLHPGAGDAAYAQIANPLTALSLSAFQTQEHMQHNSTVIQTLATSFTKKRDASQSKFETEERTKEYALVLAKSLEEGIVPGNNTLNFSHLEHRVLQEHGYRDVAQNEIAPVPHARTLKKSASVGSLMHTRVFAAPRTADEENRIMREINTRIETRLEPLVCTMLEDELKPKVRSKLKKDLTEPVKQELRTELAPKVRAELEPHMRVKLTEEQIRAQYLKYAACVGLGFTAGIVLYHTFSSPSSSAKK